MREILFRGKRKVNDEWVQGFLFVSRKGECKIKWYDPEYGSAKTSEVYPDTVGQYTGLTDKNGKKIFEGDVIKSDNGKQSAVSVVCYGEFSPRMFYDLLENFVMPRPKEKLVGLFLKSTKNDEEMFLSNCSKLIEVIGNIHDNPELLGGADGG